MADIPYTPAHRHPAWDMGPHSLLPPFQRAGLAPVRARLADGCSPGWLAGCPGLKPEG